MPTRLSLLLDFTCVLCALAAQADSFRGQTEETWNEMLVARRAADIAFVQGRDNGEWDKVRDQLTAKLDRAGNAFADTVREAWPYPVDEERAAAALLALRKARRAVGEDYPAGRIGRQATVQLWLAIAQQFPGTLEHDEALFMAATLYLQSFGREDFTADLPAARDMFERLLARPGPPSGWTLRAEESLVSFSDSAEERLDARSAMLARLREFESPDRLADSLLIPRPESSPEQMLNRVDDVLTHVSAIRRTTAVNVVGDARMTKNAYASLRELAADHQGDEFVETAICFGRGAPDLSLGWRGLLFHWTAGVVAFLAPIVMIRWLMKRRSPRGACVNS